MKEALQFLYTDKEGNYVFRKANIADILIEASGLGAISRVFNMNIKKPLAWISKGSLKWIEDIEPTLKPKEKTK